MMNFSAFGGPFSGIHQFAAKFGHDTQTPGAFSTPGINGNTSTDNHVQRYQTNGNHFNQNVPNVSAANNTMQYGQNISIPYSQPQTDLNFLNSTDHKKIHPKIERDREEGEYELVIRIKYKLVVMYMTIYMYGIFVCLL
ncbi:uncharacterized protein LOC119675654 [Teleopsis dalmanni]|uniref:uncharacterized protein LOC119675654 n=1 Tax=Teleopsis dalmanni TaxID=139649 RepID=UPI0018CE5B8F|nr:uncharacterized protein LOC119675654 [Teleopsis dalmanni]